METTVKLQELYAYSILPISIIAILVIAITIYILIEKIKKKNEIVKIEDVKIVEPKNIKSIQNKYLKRLDNLRKKLELNRITTRVAYQGLSTLIRYFIYEVTDIKVQNYTLSEIETLNMPFLTELIQEYYAPEFAKQSIGDIKQAIEKTRKVVEKWN
ncbi:MAG: hypothetical protein HFJ44_05045 [Clostridia bacterium]|jgi:hypothetical protein|nr:hypothetical protein [Clostridia bacterium]